MHFIRVFKRNVDFNLPKNLNRLPNSTADILRHGSFSIGGRASRDRALRACEQAKTMNNAISKKEKIIDRKLTTMNIVHSTYHNAKKLIANKDPKEQSTSQGS